MLTQMEIVGTVLSSKCAFIEKIYKVDLPDVALSCEPILSIQKDLGKWRHENCHLFVQGNGTEDEWLFWCRKNVNTI